MVVWLHFLRGVTFFSCPLDIGQKARPDPKAQDPKAHINREFREYVGMYEITNTEKNQKTASTYETISLLYLIGKRKDRKRISIISIDTLNDVTGMCNNHETLWDVQAKGVKSLTPKSIGTSLFTLYKNYISSFKNHFKEYIIVTPEIKRNYFLHPEKHEYTIDNFKNTCIVKIRTGLVAAANAAGKTTNSISIADFLNRITFVESLDDESTYIKNVIRFKSKNKKNTASYEAIFKEIRDKQSSIKNYCVEGNKISHPREILTYKKHINKSDIEMLIVNRLVGEQVFNQDLIPNDFFEELIGLDKDSREDLINDCNSDISRAFFNKNSKKEFWDLFNQILTRIQKNSELTPRETLEGINESVIKKASVMKKISIIFLIAIIKQGLSNEN